MDGPVYALDTALRKALECSYAAVAQIHLTASKVRVLIESFDGKDSWATVGVSSDILKVSWLVLVDSFEYKLIKDLECWFRRFL